MNLNFGSGEFEQLPNYLSSHNIDSPLVLISRSVLRFILQSSNNRHLREFFQSNTASIIEVSPELQSDVNMPRLWDLADRPRFDAVIGIGGGSTLDLAKLLALKSPLLTNVMDVKQIATRSSELQKVRNLLLIPTTFGSGSEATPFSVMYSHGNKYSIDSSELMADLVLIDPNFGFSIKSEQRAISGMDAIAQSIESLWAVRGTEVSRSYAQLALSLLLPAIEPFVNEKGHAHSEQMALGSHFAGRAIAISRTTGAHALSYHLTSQFGVPHGLAVAFTLGRFIDLHLEASDGSLKSEIDFDVFQNAMASIRTFLPRSGNPGTEFVRDLAKRLGLDLKLSAYLKRHSVTLADEIARSVNEERMRNNPLNLTHEQIVDLVRFCL